MRIGYKKCYPTNNPNERVIGVFEIPSDTNILPEIDNIYAKYKVNKCKLIRVENLVGDIIDVDSVKPLIFFSNEPQISYKIEENINIEDTTILMFFDKVRAQFYLVETVKNGLLIKWRDNGNKISKEIFLNYLREGECIYYYPNGNAKELAIYTNDRMMGKQYLFDLDGNIEKINDFTPKPFLQDSKST